MASPDSGVQRAPVIEGLFPIETRAAEVFGLSTPFVLHPDEMAETGAMGESRLRQYSGGRACAHSAMTALGLPESPLLSHDDRPPRWPVGVTGSISHTRTWCGAVVAVPGAGDSADAADQSAATELPRLTVGLDGETVGRVTDRLWDRLFVAEERAHLRQLTDPTLAATVMFSAKESFYKAQYPRTRAWVGFEDVRVEWLDVGLSLHPVTDLPALNAVNWPVMAQWERRGDLVVTGLVAEPASV